MRRWLPLLILALCPLASATDHFLDCAVGSSGNGASWATAWKTLANITGLSPGDRVFISGSSGCSTYTGDPTFQQWAPINGTVANPIIYRVAQTTDTGHTNPVTLNITGGVVGTGNLLQGVWIDGNPGNNTINMSINGLIGQAGSIAFNGVHFSYLTMNNTIIEMTTNQNFILEHVNATVPAGQDHFWKSGASAGAIGYTNNLVHDNVITLSQVNDSSGHGTDGFQWIENVSFYNNVVVWVFNATANGQHADGIQTSGPYIWAYNNYFENAGNYDIYGDLFGNTAHWRINNNIFTEFSGHGSNISAYAVGIGFEVSSCCTLDDFIVSNNTISMANGLNCIGINPGQTGNNATNTFVENNTCYNTSLDLQPGTGGSIVNSHNVLGTTNIVFANPIAYPSGDWHETSASTATIGQGINPAPANLTGFYTTDKDGNIRGNPWDTGAYQFSVIPSFSCSPITVPANHSGNISLTCTGNATTWNGSTAFSVSGVTGAAFVSKANNSATSETVTITTGSGTGTLTITDTTDSINSAITIATATVSISPSSGVPGTGGCTTACQGTITFTGTNTLWSSENASTLFGLSGGTGASLGTPTVTSNTSATATLTWGSASTTETITDNSTTATASFTVATATLPTVTTGTAGTLSNSSAIISSNSYSCTGSCAAVTSEGVCYSAVSNPPVSPCTSDGTASPFTSNLSGLSPNVVYHYQAFATNSAGTARGSVSSFTVPILSHVSGACTKSTSLTGGSNAPTFSCTANAINDAVTFFVACHPSSGAISSITLAASGWTITALGSQQATGGGTVGAEFGAIAPNTSVATFTATFNGVANCSTFGVAMSDEFSGNSKIGGATTFPVASGSGGASGGCNQAAANVTPTSAGNGIWFACLDSASGTVSPWTEGVDDTQGDNTIFQMLSGGLGVAQSPTFPQSQGAYIVEGVAIAPANVTHTSIHGVSISGVSIH